MSSPTPPAATQDPGSASIGLIISCSALVFIMIPGVGLFYSGLSRSKNALSLIMLSILSMAVVIVQWVLFGYSLAFSDSGSPFMGNFAMAGLANVGATPIPVIAPAIPSILFAVFQMQFASITVALIYGAVVERIRLIPALVFAFLWTTLVYDPITYWSWANHGWIRNLGCLTTAAPDHTPCGVGSLDFAGGGPVHVASGFAGLAYCLVVGNRRYININSKGSEFLPHNITNVFIGTALLWFGWFGFNGGSAMAATPRAAMAVAVTLFAAAAGALSWTLVDYINTKNYPELPFARVPFQGIFAFDDSLDAWGVHGVGGMLGSILTGVFAQKTIASLDGTSIDGGWIDGNWIQVGYQTAGTLAIAAWSFIVSCIILYLMNIIPGLELRPTPEEEDAGADYTEMGETSHITETTRMMSMVIPSLSSDVGKDNTSSTPTLKMVATDSL
ncbi:hypothetical protein BASA83_009900 [Batrachochytrium salamandrivorans]|nr:hypothetical protein BASA83_009900 [Batrachochytrium salamandrivorans]